MSFGPEEELFIDAKGVSMPSPGQAWGTKAFLVDGAQAQPTGDEAFIRRVEAVPMKVMFEPKEGTDQPIDGIDVLSHAEIDDVVNYMRMGMHDRVAAKKGRAMVTSPHWWDDKMLVTGKYEKDEFVARVMDHIADQYDGPVGSDPPTWGFPRVGTGSDEHQPEAANFRSLSVGSAPHDDEDGISDEERSDSDPEEAQTAVRSVVSIPKQAAEEAQENPKVAELKERLIKAYPRLFSGVANKNPPDRGRFGTAKIKLKPNPKIYRHREYQLQGDRAEAMKKLLAEFIERGWIEPSDSEWASPAFIVPKKEKGEWRLVVDYRGLNEQTEHDSYSLPLIDSILQKQQKKRIFTVLDLKHGYHQMPLHPDSRPCTAMSTPLGPMQWKVVPMGAKNGNAAFQRMMEDLLGPVRDCADPFVDDIIIGSGTENMTEDELIDAHEKDLRRVLSELDKHNMVCKPTKASLFVKEVEFAGHVVGHGQRRPMPGKLASLHHWEKHQTISELRSFMGFCNYYSGYVRMYAELSGPLHKMLQVGKFDGRKGSKKKLAWTAEAEDAFNSLKERLLGQLGLLVVDPGLETRESQKQRGRTEKGEREEKKKKKKKKKKKNKKQHPGTKGEQQKPRDTKGKGGGGATTNEQPTAKRETPTNQAAGGKKKKEKKKKKKTKRQGNEERQQQRERGGQPQPGGGQAKQKDKAAKGKGEAHQNAPGRPARPTRPSRARTRTHTHTGTRAARSRGRAAGGGTAPDTRRPSQRRKAPPPGTPFRHPHSEQRRPARAHAVGPVQGPHARIDRTRDTRVAEPWLPAPEDGRPGEGQRLTPGAPHNGGRHPPRGRPSATPTASNAGPQGRTLWGRCRVHTPASNAPGTHGLRNPGCPLQRTGGRGRDSV